MRTHPLNDNSIFENLIVFENDILQNKCTNQILFQMASIYTSLVEYYDHIKDPIARYFAEKIDILFGSKIAQSVLDHQTKSDLKLEELRENRRMDLNFDTKKELRNKMVYFNNKIKQENAAEKHKLLRDIIETHQEKYQKIKNHIKKEITNQESEIHAKLEERRNRRKT